MTAPDPRLDEIQARFQQALSTFAWPETPEERDAAENELTADVAYLLAELRKAHEALAQVEGLCGSWQAMATTTNTADTTLRAAVHALRAAVAAANGDGQ